MQIDFRKRAVFARYLFTLAQQQSKQAEPQRFAALLTAMDAVELVLRLGCTRLDANMPRDASIQAYFGAANAKLTARGMPTLEHEAAIGLAQKDRNRLKHEGLLPHASDLAAHLSVIEAFLVDAAPKLFDVAFSQLTLIEVVECEKAREQLIDGDTKLDRGELEAASVAFSAAHEELHMWFLAEAARDHGSSWDVLPQFQPFRRHGGEVQGARDRETADYIARAVEENREGLHALEIALNAIRIGISPSRSLRFDGLAPSIKIGRDGVWIRLEWDQRKATSRTDAEFMRDYVIEVALRDRAGRPRTYPLSSGVSSRSGPSAASSGLWRIHRNG